MPHRTEDLNGLPGGGGEREAGNRGRRLPVDPRRRPAQPYADRPPLTFRGYYNRRFRYDLAAVLEQVTRCPVSLCFLGDPKPLQPGTVSTENIAILGMPAKRRDLFALALYLTVLTDQVAYTYFRAHYPKFWGLTRYPKWLGDCPGACRANIHPRHILAAVGSGPHGQLPSISDNRLEALRLAVPEFEREVRSFVKMEMPELGREFWRRCVEEEPLSRVLPAPLQLPLILDSHDH